MSGNPSFVQPLPEGETLLVEARSAGGSRGGENAAVYDAQGRWVRGAHLGDAVGHVLVTAGGAVWVGYFDEAAALGRGLGGHGLVRFDADLRPQWKYPLGHDLPPIADCMALNVSGEAAWAHIYHRPYHLISVDGADARDHGPSPAPGAPHLLIDGSRGALIGGHGADVDLITPIVLAPDGVQSAGPRSRLVLPDGMDVGRTHTVCRGSRLHVVLDATVYRLDLDDIISD